MWLALNVVTLRVRLSPEPTVELVLLAVKLTVWWTAGAYQYASGLQQLHDVYFWLLKAGWKRILLIPQYFNSMFTLNSSVHSYLTRHNNDFHLANFRSNISKFNVRVQGPLLWTPCPLSWQVFLIWDCLSVAIKCIYYSSCNPFPSTVQLSVRMYFASAFILFFFLVVICYNRVLPCTSFY